MAQSSDFPLRKPPGFHWDFFLLGVTTFIAGLLGLPAPNGLIPQAPIHTTSLVVMGKREKRDSEATPPDPHDGSTALHAATTSCIPEVWLLLLTYPGARAVLSQRDSNGQTPLDKLRTQDAKCMSVTDGLRDLGYGLDDARSCMEVIQAAIENF